MAAADGHQDAIARLKPRMINASSSAQAQTRPPSQRVQDDALATSCWIVAAVLGSFICIAHAGVMVSLSLGRIGISAIAPAAFATALFGGYHLACRGGLAGGARFIPLALTAGLLATSLAWSAWYLDLSWDGQWYHQTAIYAIAADWNPLSDPMRPFADHLELWPRHYAKGPWYLAAAIYSTFGSVEAGKCVTLLAVSASFFAVAGAALQWGMTRRRAVMSALLVAINPVATSELATFMIDGVMIGFLVVVAAAVFSAFHRPTTASICAGTAASLVSINTKFTGLIFLCFIVVAGGLWVLLRKPQCTLRYSLLVVLRLVVGVGVLGYNPYVTNTLERHHPLYPVLGTAAFPSLTAQNREGIELYETPKNLVGKSRFVRLAYATFGRPSNAPYHNQANAQLMWPLTARWRDLFCYRFHETRVAGFGPFFGGALILAFGLLFWLLREGGSGRAAVGLALATLVASLSISQHLWWPRYGPQMWLVPIVPAIFAFGTARSRVASRISWALLGTLLMSALVVTTIRLKWETRATITLRRQLDDLAKASRAGKDIEVAPKMFEVATEGRLKRWRINHRRSPHFELKGAAQLMSVVEDYPLPVEYRVQP